MVIRCGSANGMKGEKPDSESGGGRHNEASGMACTMGDLSCTGPDGGLAFCWAGASGVRSIGYFSAVCRDSHQFIFDYQNDGKSAVSMGPMGPMGPMNPGVRTLGAVTASRN